MALRPSRGLLDDAIEADAEDAEAEEDPATEATENETVESEAVENKVEVVAEDEDAEAGPDGEDPDVST